MNKAHALQVPNTGSIPEYIHVAPQEPLEIIPECRNRSKLSIIGCVKKVKKKKTEEKI